MIVVTGDAGGVVGMLPGAMGSHPEEAGRARVAPAAYGGSKRRIHIYVNPGKIEALGISQTEISEAILKNTTMIPSGIAEIGNLTYAIDAQGTIKHIEEFNDIVITHRDGIPIYIKDIGVASDASAIQTNIVRIDGKEQVY